jgi:hypothetical protein
MKMRQTEPFGTELSDDIADKRSAPHSRPKGLIFAFAGTLIFYAFVGPLAGAVALLLPGYGLQLYHIAWSNIEFHWLHTLQCPPFSGGDCLFLKPKVILPLDWQILVSGSYIIGFIPAAFAGLLVAIGMLAREDFKFRHALAFGCIVGILFAAFVGADHFLHDARFFLGSAFLAYICVFATVVCWFPVRLWWPRKRLQNSDQATPSSSK